MALDDALIRTLLNSMEGPTVDFKREQYGFIDGTKKRSQHVRAPVCEGRNRHVQHAA